MNLHQFKNCTLNAQPEIQLLIGLQSCCRIEQNKRIVYARDVQYFGRQCHLQPVNVVPTYKQNAGMQILPTENKLRDCRRYRLECQMCFYTSSHHIIYQNLNGQKDRSRSQFCFPAFFNDPRTPNQRYLYRTGKSKPNMYNLGTKPRIFFISNLTKALGDSNVQIQQRLIFSTRQKEIKPYTAVTLIYILLSLFSISILMFERCIFEAGMASP